MIHHGVFTKYLIQGTSTRSKIQEFGERLAVIQALHPCALTLVPCALRLVPSAFLSLLPHEKSSCTICSKSYGRTSYRRSQDSFVQLSIC